MTIQMKATEQYFPVVLFIMLYKVALTFESADEILKKTVEMKAVEMYLCPAQGSCTCCLVYSLFPQKKIKVFSLEVES